MWSEGCGIEEWHKEVDARRNYWRNIASLAMQLLGQPGAYGP